MAEVSRTRIVLEVDDKGSAQIKQFARNAKDANQDVRRSTKEATDEVSRFGQVSEKSFSMAKVALIGFGAAIGTQVVGAGIRALKGFGREVLRVGMEFEETFSRVKAVSGASAVDMQKLEAAAREMGKATQYTASQAAEALYNFALAGRKADESVQALPATLNLAAAGQLGMAEASEIALNIMAGYGIQADKMGHAADVLVTGFTSAKTTLADLGVGFSYVGPLAKSAGVSFEETAAALSMLGNAGFEGSRAGTALRQALSAMLNPTKEEGELLAKLGVSVKDAGGNFVGFESLLAQLDEGLAGVAGGADKTGVVMQLFGDRAGPALAALLEQGAGAIGALKTTMTEAEGTAESVRTEMEDNLAKALEETKAALQDTFITTFKEISPHLQSFIKDDLNPFINAVGDRLPAALKTGGGALKVLKNIADLKLQPVTSQASGLWDAFRGLTTSSGGLSREMASNLEPGLQRAAEKLADLWAESESGTWMNEQARNAIVQVQKAMDGEADAADALAYATELLKFKTGETSEATEAYAEDIDGVTKLHLAENEAIEKVIASERANAKAKEEAAQATKASAEATATTAVAVMEEWRKHNEEVAKANEEYWEFVDSIGKTDDELAGLKGTIEETTGSVDKLAESISGVSSGMTAIKVPGGTVTKMGAAGAGGAPAAGGGGGGGGGGRAGTLESADAIIKAALGGDAIGTAMAIFYRTTLSAASNYFQSGNVSGLRGLLEDLNKRAPLNIGMTGPFSTGLALGRVKSVITRMIEWLSGGEAVAGFGGGAAAKAGWGARHGGGGGFGGPYGEAGGGAMGAAVAATGGGGRGLKSVDPTAGMAAAVSQIAASGQQAASAMAQTITPPASMLAQAATRLNEVADKLQTLGIGGGGATVLEAAALADDAVQTARTGRTGGFG